MNLKGIEQYFGAMDEDMLNEQGLRGMARVSRESIKFLREELKKAEEERDTALRMHGLEAIAQFWSYKIIEKDLNRLLKTFKHTHVAGTTKGKYIDECAECGLDLRNPIHRRVGEPGL